MKALLNMARAFNIHLFIATQRPDDRTLPAEIRDRFGMRACLHVGNEATNDMILGKPAHADGGRATDLRYNTDRGTCIVNSGFCTNTKYTVVRTHYVSAHDPETNTPDQVTPIITRALHLLTKHGRTAHTHPEKTTDQPMQRDHLTSSRPSAGNNGYEPRSCSPDWPNSTPPPTKAGAPPTSKPR